jgi:putative NADH-flavin reductase
VNVAVFGAGGRTGRMVVAEALAKGHAVIAVVRRPPDPPLDPAARTVTGDARDAASLAQALAGADAVLSAMGPAGEDPGTVYSDAVAALVVAMTAHGPARLVIAANARVLDEDPLTGPYVAVSEEHRRALATLRGSDLSWTIVATPMLTDDAPIGTYTATLEGRGGGGEIDRADFARAIVDALDHPEWIDHAIDVTV